jgi:PIN domain nuclease of toxin-antitoxin system
MTISEIAKTLNMTVNEFVESNKEILSEIQQNEEAMLSSEQVVFFFEKYQSDKINKYKRPKESKNESLLINVGNSNVDAENLYPKNEKSHGSSSFFFNKSDYSLLKEFQEYNSIQNLFFQGVYKKRRDDYGFFQDVVHETGKVVSYPMSNEPVDRIYISTGQLINGVLYTFEAALANHREREKHKNPFLLKSKSENIEEIKKMAEIRILLNKKEKMLIEVEDVLRQKEKDANSIIEGYNLAIKEKINQINTEENRLAFLKKTFEETNSELNKMENIISTLKDRVSLCRNLQFINEDDENKYLNLLSAKEFKPINHHDFEKDFESNFSKLSDHIHAYLFHKKNLIYTRYQIKNFLTLLKTHDIVVLSGLSGSGKTQIVKAFAEALGGVAKIIPVKPNWTSSDDLIGYYNPLQMSFLPTPFTEAIVEAINNPNQLYLICLDEMNLARAEYYFADFLSKLEERSKQPEIELYANHEEALFVSEFSTLLNLLENSIKGKRINSWQEFLDNEDARKKFFEMLGNTDKESMLQLHAKTKRRLIDILKFPSTIRIPDNVRFIGAINVDETTHYFSPKILDRIHVVKFDNPLLFEEQVNSWFENTETEKELKPVYVQPNLLSKRIEFPKVNDAKLAIITKKLKEINQNFLLPLNIDFGIRSIRQSLNYAELNKSTYNYGDVFEISLNTVIFQKILPRFIFDGNETAKNGKRKIEVVEEFQKFLSNELNDFYAKYESDETGVGKSSSEYLAEMIKQADRNNSQFNFFA